MPDGLGWKISHLKQEGEIKAKKKKKMEQRKAVSKDVGLQRKET